VTDVEILLGLAFVPAIPIGFKFLDQFEASVEVNMDLPRLDAKLTTKLNAGPDCNDLPSNTSQPANANSTGLPSFQLTDALAELGPLVLVEANISISVNVGAKFEFPLLPPPLNEVASEANIFATTFTLGTTCLAAGKGYSTATDIWNSMTSTLGITDALPIYTPTPSPTAYEQPECDKTTSCSCAQTTTTVYVAPPPAHEVPPPAHEASKTSVVEHSTTETPPPPATNLPPPVVPPVAPSYPVSVNTTIVPTGTGTSTPPVPTSPEEFTGAAFGLFVPRLIWGWQAVMLSVSGVAGTMILL
jgi:hypothetical protein